MNPETRAFLDRVRSAELASPADAERVYRALQISLAKGLGPSVLDAAVSPRSWWHELTRNAVGFGGKVSVVAVSAAAALGPADSPARSPLVESTAAPSSATAVISNLPRAPESTSSPAPAPARDVAVTRRAASSAAPAAPSAKREVLSKPPVARRSSGGADPSLQQELQLLERVQTALKRGDGNLALHELEAHQTTDRTLLAERDAARILALCELGRTAEARSAAAQFRRRHPSSIHRQAIELSCAEPQRNESR